MIGCLRLQPPDDETLRALRLRLDQLSPRVASLPEAMLADLGRGTAADGRRHAAALHAAAADLGLAVRVGVAPSPTIATLAARLAAPAAPLVVGPSAVLPTLARCPVAWLEAFAPLAPALHGLGLSTLADVAALPAVAVGGRFGGAALAAWRTLHGDEPPIVPLPAPPRLRVRRRFEGLVGDRGVLTAAIERLVGRLAGALERRGYQARALALHLHGDDGVCAAGRVLEHPAASIEALLGIAAGLLDTAGARAGADAVELIVGELVAVRGEQLTLFGPSPGRRDERRVVLADLARRLPAGALLQPSIVPVGAALVEERGQLAGWGAP